MSFKDVAELIGTLPAIVAYFKPLPTWFRPSDSLEPNVTLAAVGFSVACCIATWVLFSFVDDPANTWTKERKLTIFRRASAMLVIAVVDMIVYVSVVRLYPYPGVAVDLIQILLWAAFFGLISIALTIFVVFQKGGTSTAP